MYAGMQHQGAERAETMESVTGHAVSHFMACYSRSHTVTCGTANPFWKGRVQLFRDFFWICYCEPGGLLENREAGNPRK